MILINQRYSRTININSHNYKICVKFPIRSGPVQKLRPNLSFRDLNSSYSEITPNQSQIIYLLPTHCTPLHVMPLRTIFGHYNSVLTSHEDHDPPSLRASHATLDNPRYLLKKSFFPATICPSVDMATPLPLQLAHPVSYDVNEWFSVGSPTF